MVAAAVVLIIGHCIAEIARAAAGLFAVGGAGIQFNAISS
jgi:hypothetical protein